MKAKGWAARYQELEGFLELEYGDARTAASLYRSAAHRYWFANEYKRVARAASKEADILESLSDYKGAARAFQIRAHNLLEENQTDAELRRQGLASILRSAGLLFRGEREQVEGAEEALEAVQFALKEPKWREHATWGGSFEEDPVNMAIISKTVNRAREIFETTGRFAEADECHVLLSRLRRQNYAETWLRRAHPIHVFSRLLDFVWGYGTRPLRIVPILVGTIIAFAIFYWIAGDVRWAAQELEKAEMVQPTLTAALALSLTSIVPVHLIQRMGDVAVLPTLDVGTVSLIAVWLESFLGSVLVGMLAFWVMRWYRRRYVA